MIEAGGGWGERLEGGCEFTRCSISISLDCVILGMPSMIITSTEITSCKLCLPTYGSKEAACLLFQRQRKLGEVGICWKAG